MRVLLGGISVAALMTGLPTLAFGQSPGPDGTQVEEVIVTAQRRSENVQDIPIAISALSAGQVQDKRIVTAYDLNNIVPSVRISGGDAAASPKIFIRGVGLNDFNPTSSSGVGLYADGVYIASPLAQMASFFDMDRIEVLRGPQGTLYGRNTTGGAINLISRRPTMEQAFNGSLEYGRYNSIKADLGYGDALVDGLLAFRVAGQYVADDGYTLNRTTGNRVNDSERLSLRAALLLTPTAQDEAVLSLTRFSNRGGVRQGKSRALLATTPGATGPDGLCAPGFYATGQCTDAVGYFDASQNPQSLESNLEAKDRVDLYSAQLSYTHEFNDMTLVSVTAYQNARRSALENTDSNPLQMLEIKYQGKQRTFSQELRLQAEKDRIKWVAGGYYMHDKILSANSTDVLRMLRPTPSYYNLDVPIAKYNYPYAQNSDSYAIFGQLDYQLTEALTLTAGLRWSKDEKSIDYTRAAEDGLVVLFQAKRSATFDDFSGRIGVEYALSPDANLYATYNRGFKSGGFFGGSVNSIEQLEPYDNETVDAFEIGSKSTLFDRTLRLNLAAFYYDYQNIQAFSLVERDGLTVQVLDNAAAAEIYGAEVEATATPIEHLDLSASFSYLHAKYGTYTSLGADYTGNQMPQAPKFTFNASASYDFELPGGGMITPAIDASYRSKVYFDSTQTERLSDDPVWLVNGQIGWTAPDGRLEAGLWAKNLTDEVYLYQATPITSLGFDLLTYAPRATYGVFIRYAY